MGTESLLIAGDVRWTMSQPRRLMPRGMESRQQRYPAEAKLCLHFGLGLPLDDQHLQTVDAEEAGLVLGDTTL